MKKISISLSLITSLFLVSFNLAYAQPQINSVSGNISDGEVITVSGVNFGANGPNIFHFNDFGHGNAGEVIDDNEPATIGKIDYLDGEGGYPIYQDEYFRSNGMAYQMNYQYYKYSDPPAGYLRPGASGLIRHSLPEGTRHVFFSFSLYLPEDSVFPGHMPDTFPNWKLFTLWDSLKYHSEGKIWVQHDTQGGANNNNWRWTNELSGGTSYVHNGYFTTETKGEWHRYHMWIDPEGADHWEIYPIQIIGSDGSVNGPGVVHRLHRDDEHSGRTLRVTLLPDELDQWRYLLLPYWGRLEDYEHYELECKPLYDDIYIAIGEHAQARIEIGNNPVYENSTNLAISTVDDWVDDEINITIRQGGFELGDNAYLFVIDADGVVSDGYPIVLGTNSSDTIPPSAPQGLSVN